MTDVLKFWFGALGNFFTKLLECTYDLFGFQVSFLEITLGILLLCVCVNFFRFSTGDMSIMRDKMGRSENKQDKINESHYKHAYKPRHVRYNLRTEKESFGTKLKSAFHFPKHGG